VSIDIDLLIKENVLERSSSPEDRDALRMAEIDLALKNEELRKIRIENDDKKDLIEHKKGMIQWTQRVVGVYLLFVACVFIYYIVFQVYLAEEPGIPQEVIITLLASTTASIVGLPFAINKSIFIK
jgi:hypothetical protein